MLSSLNRKVDRHEYPRSNAMHANARIVSSTQKFIEWLQSGGQDLSSVTFFDLGNHVPSETAENESCTVGNVYLSVFTYGFTLTL